MVGYSRIPYHWLKAWVGALELSQSIYVIHVFLQIARTSAIIHPLINHDQPSLSVMRHDQPSLAKPINSQLLLYQGAL